MGHLLDKPETEKKDGMLVEVVENGGTVRIAATSMQGWRVEMEDAHVIKINFDDQLPGHHFVGVFDGHGGDYSSAWIAERLLDFIRSEKDFDEYKASVKTSGPPNLDALKSALRLGFLKADKALLDAQNENCPGDQSGSTGVTCIVTPTHIVCANAGDSRCVMGINAPEEGHVDLSEDHKPDNDEERTRIERAGGNVSMRRVDGDLAVSRAFGDFKFKENTELPAEEQRVTANPDFIVQERAAAGDDYLLLACDGIWDVMASGEGIEYVREMIADRGETNLEKVAEEMLDCCLEKGSQDNMTALIMQFPAAVVGDASNGGVDGIRAERANRASEEEQRRLGTAQSGRVMLKPQAPPTGGANGFGN